MLPSSVLGLRNRPVSFARRFITTQKSPFGTGNSQTRGAIVPPHNLNLSQWRNVQFGEKFFLSDSVLFSRLRGKGNQ